MVLYDLRVINDLLEKSMFSTFIFIAGTGATIDSLGRGLLYKEILWIVLASFEAMTAAGAFSYKMGWLQF